jgi:hypothetical protein
MTSPILSPNTIIDLPAARALCASDPGGRAILKKKSEGDDKLHGSTQRASPKWAGGLLSGRFTEEEDAEDRCDIPGAIAEQKASKRVLA